MASGPSPSFFLNWQVQLVPVKLSSHAPLQTKKFNPQLFWKWTIYTNKTHVYQYLTYWLYFISLFNFIIPSTSKDLVIGYNSDVLGHLATLIASISTHSESQTLGIVNSYCSSQSC